MRVSQNKVFILVCEGESEVAYIQELNRLLRELEINTTLRPICIGSGFFSKVVATYKSIRKNNPRTKTYIWVDWDIYARNERDCGTAYTHKPDGIPDFCFSRQNFEDFLATHLSEDELNRWLEACQQNGHLAQPLHGDEYIPLFKSQLFPTYFKGNLPFELTEVRVRQMLENQSKPDMPLHCELADLIIRIMT